MLQLFPCILSTTIYSFTSRETSTCEDRQSSGLICQSCDLIATCVKVNNIWMTVPVERCDMDEGFYCNLNAQGCSNATGPCHPIGFEGNFACTSEGVYPDPYDCQKYHMCYKAGSTLVSANIDCGADKAFSAATGDCSLYINSTTCINRQYDCTNAGDSKSWPGNLNIFYICKARIDNSQRILYPTLYRCASGEVFNGRNCVQRSEYTGQIDNGSNNNGSSGDNGHLPFVCSKPGLFPVPNNCQSYYFCNAFLRLKMYNCPFNTHFEASAKACLRGACQNR